jgi:hypothetical protein
LSTACKAAVTLLVVIPALSLAFPSTIASDRNRPELEMTSSGPPLSRGRPSNWNVYRSEPYGFQMQYPPDFEIAAVPNALAAEGAVVTFVPRYDPSIDSRGAKTNLIGFSVTVGVTSSAVAPSSTVSCLSRGARQNLHWSPSRRIPFARHPSSEGAAGNRYQTLSYLTDRGGRAYEIVLFIHSGNPGNYSPGAITTFDRAEITRLFDVMVSTFRLAR